MIREVHAPDGRTWTVRREINWAKLPQDHEFEHDVAAGRIAGPVMLTLVGLMILTGVVWLIYLMRAGVVVPLFPVWALLALMLVIPLQWALARPWTIVAATHEPTETGGEEWAGTVRGVMGSRYEANRVAQHLADYAVPDDGRGPLQPLYPRQ